MTKIHSLYITVFSCICRIGFCILQRAFPAVQIYHCDPFRFQRIIEIYKLRFPDYDTIH